MRTLLTIVSVFIFANAPVQARADNTSREFLMSCTYGVLAGTLVGAASLAFTSKPNENMYRVARGASLGLYAGILLGLYVIYVVPGMEENPEDIPVGAADHSAMKAKLAVIDRFPIITPRFTDNYKKIDGLEADWTVLRF